MRNNRSATPDVADYSAGAHDRATYLIEVVAALFGEFNQSLDDVVGCGSGCLDRGVDGAGSFSIDQRLRAADRPDRDLRPRARAREFNVVRVAK